MTPGKPGVRLTVKVSPGASRNEIAGFRDDVLLVKIAAAPEKGKANRELIDFLSDKLGIRKSDINVLRGETSRTKLLEIIGLPDSAIREKLENR